MSTLQPSASSQPSRQAGPSTFQLPDPAELERLSAWSGEMLWWQDEPVESVSRGWRAQAIHQAQVEYRLGLARPTADWRRRFGFCLGLLRLSAHDPIQLLDGTILAEHQAEVVEAVLAHLAERLEHPQRLRAPADDPARQWRCWYEHATGAGKTVAACALVDAMRCGGVLILTHRQALVEQFARELRQRGYGARLTRPESALANRLPNPVSITTYSWFARNWDLIDPTVFQLVLCDEVHQSLGERTSNAIKAHDQLLFIGMTATGQLLAKDVSDLFPHRVSQFDLDQATALGVISPLRCLRVPSGVSTQTLEGVRRVAGDFAEEELSSLLNHQPFNYACATFYRDTFGQLPGVVYAAGVEHAEQVAVAFVRAGIPAAAVSGRTPRGELQRILRDFEQGKLRVLINAQLLVEGWNSPRVTVCLHLAPTASRRVYQQRIGRVTRRHPAKEAGIVVDFVPDAYPNDGTVVTLHSLLDRPVYEPLALVTHPPADQPHPEPAKVNVPPHTRRALVSPDPHQRRRLMAEQLDAFALEDLTGPEVLSWAQAAVEQAQTPQQLQARLKQLERRGVEFREAAARLALDHRNPAVRELASRELAEDADEETLEELIQLALSSDSPTESRRLLWQVLEAVRDGAQIEPYRLLELARVERGLYERLALSNPTYRQLRLEGISAEDERTIARLCRASLLADVQVAAALLVCLPDNRVTARQQIAATLDERFTSAAQLAQALLAVRHD